MWKKGRKKKRVSLKFNDVGCCCREEHLTVIVHNENGTVKESWEWRKVSPFLQCSSNMRTCDGERERKEKRVEMWFEIQRDSSTAPVLYPIQTLECNKWIFSFFDRLKLMSTCDLEWKKENGRSGERKIIWEILFNVLFTMYTSARWSVHGISHVEFVSINTTVSAKKRLQAAKLHTCSVWCVS